MAPLPALRRLTTIQESHANELSSMHARLRERDPATLNRNILKARLQTLKDVWSEARKMHEEIIVRADVADSDYITNSFFAQMTITYVDLLDDLVTRISHYEIPQGNLGSCLKRERAAGCRACSFCLVRIKHSRIVSEIY